jgi:GT2 family glycosyltransferase
LNLKIVIVNNDIEDDLSYLEETKQVEIINTQKNLGFSKAVNIGIMAFPQAEYCFVLNNDAFITYGCIEKMVEILEKDPKVFSVSAKMLQEGHKELIDDAGDEYTIFGWGYQRGYGKKKNSRFYSRNKIVFSSCAGAALYKRSILEEIGLFDENFFAYMEDIDLGYRARINGYISVYCSQAEVYHIGSASSGSRYNALKVRFAARNNVYVSYKNMPLIQLIINFPFLVSGFLIKFFFFCGKKLGKEYSQGVFEGLKTVHKLNKVPLRGKNFTNYLKIEWLLIKNSFSYFFEKFF